MDIAAEVDKVPAPTIEHFFVDADTSDPGNAEEVVGLHPTVSNPESITRFLTLPTSTARAPRQRLIDPMVDFSKSVMLTSDIYVSVVEQLQEKKEEAAIAKERYRIEREEMKRRKLLERKEERRQREARAVEVAEARVSKAQEREEAARAKALQWEEVAWMKAEHAALLESKRTLKAVGRRMSRRLEVSTTVENTEVCQTNSRPMRGGGGDDMRSPHVDMQEPQGDFSFFNQQPTAYASSSNGQFLFYNAFNQFGAPLESTLSSQPSAMVPHFSGMPQFSLPYPVAMMHLQPWPFPPCREQ